MIHKSKWTTKDYTVVDTIRLRFKTVHPLSRWISIFGYYIMCICDIHVYYGTFRGRCMPPPNVLYTWPLSFQLSSTHRRLLVHMVNMVNKSANGLLLFHGASCDGLWFMELPAMINPQEQPMQHPLTLKQPGDAVWPLKAIGPRRPLVSAGDRSKDPLPWDS